MRLVTRLVATAVALVMGLTLAVGLVSPAQAAPAPKHDGRVSAKEIGTSNRFVIYGKIKTASGKVKILRNAGGGKYRVFKTVKLKSNGKFRTRITQVGDKRTCFRVQVPAKNGYRKTTFQAPCIVTV